MNINIKPALENIKLENYISWRAFSAGLASFTLLTIIMVALCAIKSETTLEKRLNKLEATTVIIEHVEKPVGKLAPEDHGTPPQNNHDQEIDHGISSIIENFMDLDRYAGGMAKAPIEGLYKESEHGKLPVSRDDGLTPFVAYLRPINTSAIGRSKAVISIVVSDIGISQKNSQTALEEMPLNTTFLLSPYTKTPNKWRKKIARKGSETWLEMPLEPIDPFHQDTGSMTLMRGVSLETNRLRLHKLLGIAEGYAGIIASRGTSFYNSELEAKAIVKEIFERGLGYADATAQLQVIPQNQSLITGGAYAYADLWINDVTRPDVVKEQLSALKELAINHGYAVGFIHPVPQNMKIISRWVHEQQNAGIMLVPLSAQSWRKE